MKRLCNPDEQFISASQPPSNSQTPPLVSGKASLMLPGRRNYKSKKGSSKKKGQQTSEQTPKKTQSMEVEKKRSKGRRVVENPSERYNSSVISAQSSDWYIPPDLANQLDPTRFE